MAQVQSCQIAFLLAQIGEHFLQCHHGIALRTLRNEFVICIDEFFFEHRILDPAVCAGLYAFCQVFPACPDVCAPFEAAIIDLMHVLFAAEAALDHSGERVYRSFPNMVPAAFIHDPLRFLPSRLIDDRLMRILHVVSRSIFAIGVFVIFSEVTYGFAHDHIALVLFIADHSDDVLCVPWIPAGLLYTGCIKCVGDFFASQPFIDIGVVDVSDDRCLFRYDLQLIIRRQPQPVETASDADPAVLTAMPH